MFNKSEHEHQLVATYSDSEESSSGAGGVLNSSQSSISTSLSSSTAWASMCNKSPFALFTYYFRSILLFVASTLLMTLIICGGLVLSTNISGYNIYNLRNPVNKSYCTCDCWDGFFRGVHSRSGYKVFYFNYEPHMVSILFVFLIYSQMLRMCLLKMYSLAMSSVAQIFKTRRKLTVSSLVAKLNFRLIVLVNLVVSIYSNYYGIWSVINYLNDFDRRMMRSQLFFCLTELIPSFVYYHCLDKRGGGGGGGGAESDTTVPISLAYPVMAVSLVHIYLAVPERMLWGFFATEAQDALRNKARDMGLMSTDVLGLVFVAHTLFRAIKQQSGEDVVTRGHAYYLKPWLFLSVSSVIFYKLFCAF